jgi:hypothetical protein
VEIAQAALDAYIGKPFAWGENDCARLGAFVLRLAGYKPNLSRFGAYRSELSAVRALKRHKLGSLTEAVDEIGLMRIAPAATLPGDLISFPGDTEGGLDGLTVVLGNGRVLGFTASAEAGACSIIAARLEHALAAWSVPPNG